MKPTVYMEEMDAFTYREKLAKDAVVFIPVGALEQHGSHMAMCVDAALTKAMAGATAEALVADVKAKIDRAREEMAAAIEKVKLIDRQAQEENQEHNENK